jgi:3-deoxy-D-manno-octulosonic-acid transferase
LPFPVSRLSELNDNKTSPDVIIVDSIGLLSILYTLGKVAYIGGGFGAGIHNTLEPMAHGKPIIFGPRFDKFPEAVDMVEANAAWPVRSVRELTVALNTLLQPGISEKTGKTAHDYLVNHSGASDKVADYLLESLYLAASKHDNE